MKVSASYSHKNGLPVIEKYYSLELQEIMAVIQNIDASPHLSKISIEKTMPGRTLYNPKTLNQAFKTGFYDFGWRSSRIVLSNSNSDWEHVGFREVDFVKNQLAVEVQFGKYAFLIYDIICKMVIFSKHGLIQAGVEILPMKHMTGHMSSGIGHFQQVVADLQHRGEADIDIPVLLIGIEPD